MPGSALDLNEFNQRYDHRHGVDNIVLHNLMPYLDDYIMNVHDQFIEDFIWSMDDSRHTESTSKELTEIDVPRLLLFADKDVVQAVRTSSSSAAAEVAGCDPTRAAQVGAQEVKRHRQGLRTDELGLSDVLDVTVFNLGNLARQTIQHQAEPRMLRLIVNQTSRIMMLVEGTSLAVNQWDRKSREAKWTLRDSVHQMTITTGLVFGRRTIAPPLGSLSTTVKVSTRKSGTQCSRSALSSP